ncbi:MAG TPA: hypothetical protein VL727_04920 [Puia sp.]|nr:hypothetical protein [Puia sp.]
MNLSRKQNRRLLWILLIPFILLLTGGAVLYFLVVHHFKEGVSYIINKESKGKYAFDASEAELSFRRKSIRLKKAVLYTPDTTSSNLYFTISIPEIYFSLSSWKELLFNKKVMVDSLSIIEPAIDLHVHTVPIHKEHTDFHASDILSYLEQALTRFNVHSFSLKDASFSYQQQNTPLPFRGDHINLSVSNFAAINNEDSHLLGSDKVTILLGRQDWHFPDGRNDISFKQLSFDSKDQRFELDSFSFSRKVPVGKGTIHLEADKFLFTSRHLPAIYQKEQLLLDSLLCINPVLSIPGYPVEKNNPDSSGNIRSKHDLFNFINIKYIGVTNGDLLLQDKEGRTGKATYRKANMKIFNLAVHPSIDPYPLSDSIRIDLKNIGFLTRDSLYQLTIGEFSFHRNDALFSQVKFEPVRHTSDRYMEFTAPSLLLKNINIVELMRRRLTSSGAELREPLITLNDKPKPGSARKSSLPFPANNAPSLSGNEPSRLPSDKKMALFYRTLHHVSELINTPYFDIIDGSAHYHLTGEMPLDATVKKIEAHILLNKFFVSDSLVDIKHAIPDLRIGQVNLTSGKAVAAASGFWFDGVQRHSRVKELDISTNTGFQLKGEDVYWNIFDWDIYQKNKDIQIDSFYASRLTIHTKPAGTAAASATPQPPLPTIRITHLQADKLLFDRLTHNSTVHFTIDNLHATNLASADKFFTWTSLNVNLSDIGVETPKTNMVIKTANFNSDSGLSIQNLNLQSLQGPTALSISAPLVRIDAALSSSDLRHLPQINVKADNLDIRYNKITEKDTLQTEAVASLQVTNLLFKPGHSPHLSSAIHLTINKAGFKYNKDSSALAIDEVAGFLKEDSFHWSPSTKIDWRQLAGTAVLNTGIARYRNKKLTATAAACSWNPAGRSLQLSKFNITPNESLATTFSKAQWQSDYIYAKGEKLTLSNIQFPAEHQPLSIRMSGIILDSIELSASRDKHMSFRHGIEKPMPTKLITVIPFPVNVDTISIHSTTVTYNERSIATGKWSSIPIRNINGTITNLYSRNNDQDTLKINAAGSLFDGHIRHFSYRESYGDSLSSFSAQTWFSAIDLTQFSQVSIPAAAVSITGGHADTSWSSWQGNKYATFGTMNFWYKKLHIKVLNKTDSTKRGFLPTLETWLANLILPAQRKKSSAIFVQRDREKFVFNYWVKAQTSGLLSTLGIKSSRSYLRQYRRLTQNPTSVPPLSGSPSPQNPRSFTQTSNSSPD